MNSDGSVTVEIIHYFDDACTQPERDAVSVFASSGGTATIARTVTTYNLAHLQLGVRKGNYALTGATNNGSWVVTSAFYPGTATSPITQYGPISQPSPICADRPSQSARRTRCASSPSLPGAHSISARTS